jgi:hypothetical protein
MDRAIKLTVFISAIEDVHAFRSLVVAWPRLRAARVAAEGNFVCLDDATVMQQGKGALVLYDEDPVGLESRRQMIF